MLRNIQSRVASFDMDYITYDKGEVLERHHRMQIALVERDEEVFLDQQGGQQRV